MAKEKRSILPKILALIIVFTMVFSAVAMSLGTKHSLTKRKLTEEDIKIAAEIANMTGADIEEIKKLREYGQDFNTILETFKGDEQAESLLYTNKNYLAMGFNQEEISEVKLLINRAVYQLEELTSDMQNSIIPEPNPVVDIFNKEEDLTPFKELLTIFKIDDAIELTLKLKQDFNNIEEALNEYLYSLQLNVDLKLYFKDKEKYQEQKSEKQLLFVGKERITLALIEEKLLKKLQEQNDKQFSNATEKQNIISDKQTENNAPEVPLVTVPTPNSVKPVNPKDELNKEISTINPMNEKGR